MYKLLLCVRYLRTRYLAFVCIVSVCLGVATLIVVNSVMGGFSTKLKERLHGLLSDVQVEALTFDGFADPDGKMRKIREDPFLCDKVAAMTPTLEVFAMVQFHFRCELIARPVRLIGIDPEGRARIGGFSAYLLHQKNNPRPSFALDDKALAHYRRGHLLQPDPRRHFGQHFPPPPVEHSPFDDDAPPLGQVLPGKPAPAPWVRPEAPEVYLPPGLIIGNAIASFRDPSGTPGEKPKDLYILRPGDDVVVTTVSGQRLAPVSSRFVVCDYFKSEMSEYDSNYVFVPLDYLQRLRTMEGRVTGIQVRLNDYRDAPAVVRRLTDLFAESSNVQVTTWEHKQGALLAAISIEKGLLNVLLFLIIAVAGFGILAIFSMIVTEKTRDIGILKALGASCGGVLLIFLGYGLLLGLLGAGLGTGLGLTLTNNINEIEQSLTKLTGQEIFDRRVYYFDRIPTDVQPWAVALVNLGAVAIAVAFSILPALRAALLHPVRALRYE